MIKNTAIIFFISLFFIYSLPDHILKNHNQNSRFDLVFAIVDNQTFSIDAFHQNTIDKSFFNGHYYCDKAIGLSMLGVPVYLLLKKYFSIINVSLNYNRAAYFIRIFTVSFIAALGGAIFFLTFFYFTSNYFSAVINTLTLTLATPYCAYSVMFYGHTPAAVFLFSGFALVLLYNNVSINLKKYFPAAAGLLLSVAVFIEYPAFIIAACVSIYAFISNRFSKKYIFLFFIGGLPVLCFQMYYNFSVSGDFFFLTYMREHSQFFQTNMSSGFFGIHFPSIKNIVFMLVSLKRGLLVFFPSLIIYFFHYFFSLPKKIFLFSLFCSILFFIFISGYYEISGGWAFSIRHIIPCLPFLVFSLILKKIKPVFFYIIIFLLVISSVHSVLGIITDPQIPDFIRNPLVEFNYYLAIKNKFAEFGFFSNVYI